MFACFVRAIPRQRGFLASRLAVEPLFVIVLLLAIWEFCARANYVAPYVLPSPSRIMTTLVTRFDIIWPEALVTSGEILGGFVLGSLAGIMAALLMAASPRLSRALGPLLVVAQALPVFAIAPLLVIWFGFGIAPKLVMAGLIIFFPVATSFFDGLRRTDAGLLDLARLNRAPPLQILRLIRVPAALPQLMVGLRVAAAVAPLGAIVGEWAGGAAGLGLLMLHANARTQTDMVFACLTVLVALSLSFWALAGEVTRRLLPWAPDNLS